MFNLFIGAKANKQLDDLDSKTKKKIEALFNAIKFNPWPAKEYDLAKLEGLEDCFRIRIGDYRICYKADTSPKEITVYKIERRSDSTYK